VTWTGKIFRCIRFHWFNECVRHRVNSAWGIPERRTRPPLKSPVKTSTHRGRRHSHAKSTRCLCLKFECKWLYPHARSVRLLAGKARGKRGEHPKTKESWRQERGDAEKYGIGRLAVSKRRMHADDNGIRGRSRTSGEGVALSRCNRACNACHSGGKPCVPASMKLSVGQSCPSRFSM
jgi:hypothetical protein